MSTPLEGMLPEGLNTSSRSNHAAQTVTPPYHLEGPDEGDEDDDDDDDDLEIGHRVELFSLGNVVSSSSKSDAGRLTPIGRVETKDSELSSASTPMTFFELAYEAKEINEIKEQHQQQQQRINEQMHDQSLQKAVERDFEESKEDEESGRGVPLYQTHRPTPLFGSHSNMSLKMLEENSQHLDDTGTPVPPPSTSTTPANVSPLHAGRRKEMKDDDDDEDGDKRQHRRVFGWYRDDNMAGDTFTLEQIGASYDGTPLINIGQHLIEEAERENIKYLTVCIPCYNEGKEEMFKTMLSLMQCAEFMKKARMNEDKSGRALEREFQRTRWVLVPIMDGVKAMADSMKEWLSANFKGALDSLIYPVPDKSPRKSKKLSRKNSIWAKKYSKIHVKAVCRKWWYYMHEVMPKMGMSTEETVDDHLLSFYILPIVKLQNHRKHNSHQWFFDAVCEVLGDKCTYAFLTDCGTTYDPKCVAILMKELFLKPSLIGVTARQRVEWPNKYFQPCEDSPWPCFRGNHEDVNNKKPCWKCYATYLLSPCPLQGFEFEASLVLNLSVYNLVECLPVMPGPCQLLHWQKMKRNQVVKEYFNLLFKGEINKRENLELPDTYQKMIDDDLVEFIEEDELPEEGEIEYEDEEEEDLLGDSDSDRSSNSDLEGGGRVRKTASSDMYFASRSRSVDHLVLPAGYNFDNFNTVVEYTEENSPMLAFEQEQLRQQQEEEAALLLAEEKKELEEKKAKGGHGGHGAPASTLSFTEFLRTNMRLAEDRVLSFVAVFSTMHGTKWVVGSVFYYTPEIKWQTLLLQRRRWINGTFASYLFFMKSERAHVRMQARMFDGHSFAKNMVMFLWKINLFQLLLVFISPGLFGSMFYVSLIDVGKRFPLLFFWALIPLYGWIRVVEVATVGFYVIYAVWSLYSHFINGGRIPEPVCQFLALLGVFFMIPVYLSLWSVIFAQGLNVISVLVIISTFAPPALSMIESWKCTKLYLFYLPWFMCLVTFFLILMPAYSFARLYDTTWGNRATGSDSAVKATAEITMRRYNLAFVVLLLVMNFWLAVALIRGIRLAFIVTVLLMFFIFIPAIIQLTGATIFFSRLLTNDWACLNPLCPKKKKNDKLKNKNSTNYNTNNMMSPGNAIRRTASSAVSYDPIYQSNNNTSAYPAQFNPMRPTVNIDPRRM